MNLDHCNGPDLVEPALFWFWNQTPTTRQIDGQLDAILEKGFRAIYIHPMPQSFRPDDFHGGMTVEYLSPAFFDLIAYTCQAMSRRNMILWLYDEGGWPSGVAGGAVVAENPDFGVWVLELENGRVIPRQLLDQINYPDLMNPAATDCFIRHTHEKYRLCIGEEFGRTVRGIFTDEPRLIGRLGTTRIPWSPRLPAHFLDADVVHHLFEGAADTAQSLRIRRDYLHQISTRIAESFYSPIRAWCEQHNLLFEGHHSGENEFAQHGQYFGNYLQQARHYHVPGIDTIWRQVFPGQAGGNYVGLASSVSWLRNQRIALSESFAVYGAGLTLQQMQWVGAFQLVRGVNKIALMPSLLSHHEGRRLSVCADFSPANPIWRDLDLWRELVHRTAKFTLRGLPTPRVGIYYRIELTAPEQSAEFDRIHDRICQRVHDAMVEMVFISAQELAQAQPCEGGVRIGAAVLSMLILHLDAPLDPHEEQILDRLTRANVRLVQIDRDSEQELDLRGLCPIQLDQPPTGVGLLALAEGNWRGYLFFNANPTNTSMAIRLDDGQVLQELLLDDTMPRWMRPLEQEDSHICFDLLPGECRAFESTTSQLPAAPRFVPHQLIPVIGPWTLTQKESYIIGADIDRVMPDTPPSPVELGDYSVICPDFSGSLIYQCDLRLNDLPPDCQVLLDLGVVYYSAEVWLNGQSLGRRAWSPYWFDATAHLRPGRNDLRIRTTNTLANQWLRTDVHTQDLRRWRNAYLDISTPFMAQSLHAGLYGPVTLQVFQRTME